MVKMHRTNRLLAPWLGLLAAACSSSAGGTQAGGSGGGASGGTSPGSGSGGSGGAASGGMSGGTGGSGGSSGGTAGGATGTGGLGGGGGLGIGGPSLCSTAGVAFCESFEGGLSASLWTTTQNGDASIQVDSTRAARGTNALHIKTSAGNGHAYIKESKSFPATNNVLYGRMFVWFGDDLTTDGHFTLAEGAGTGTPGLSRFGGQFKELGVGSDLGASGDWTDHDDKLVPSKTWICAEFEFKGDTHEFRVWWDDVERTALHSGPSKHPNFTMPQFNSLWFGWWMYNAVEPQELWIDEIAVDYQPIGCAK